MSESIPSVPETPAPTNGDGQPVDPAVQPVQDQNYDKLTDPNSDLNDLTTEGAAVNPHTESASTDFVTAEQQQEAPKAPPLTPEDIPRLEKERGTAVLQADIDGMNASRQ